MIKEHNLNKALSSIYGGLDASDGGLLVGWSEAQEWPDGALDVFLASGILVSKTKARSIECLGCEYRCYKDVEVTRIGKQSRVFIVCDVPEMQSEMGRVMVPMERLHQWQCGVMGIAGIVQRLLGLEYELDSTHASLKLGMLKSPHGRRWISLNQGPLTLEINGVQVPIDEILYFDHQELVLDMVRIEELLKVKPENRGKAYNPSVTKREVRKLQTQAMYQDWKDAYIRLNKKNPDKSATWVSKQIAKMDVANGKDAQTIYKNMK